MAVRPPSFIVLFLWGIAQLSFAQLTQWPVLKTYEGAYTKRIAMPVGGIGTGTISLNGRGGLQDWEIMNRPAKGFNPALFKGPKVNRAPFFCMYTKQAGQSQSNICLLEGPLSDLDYEGELGSKATNHGLPRFDKALFQTAYPFGQVQLTDTTLPIEATVKAFNPLIPGQVDDSSLPILVLTYTLKNTSNEPLDVAVAGNIQNFIGTDGYEGKPLNNKNTFRQAEKIKGIHYTSDGVDPQSPQWGSFSLVSLTDAETTYRTHWKKFKWGNATLDFWDDFGADGLLEDRQYHNENAPMGSLAIKARLAPHTSKDFKFLISWHFPNRPHWPKPGFQKFIPGLVGNYYTSQYKDSWEVALHSITKLARLEKETADFVHTFIAADMPQAIKEAALFNLANLRTQLAFRTKTGHLMGWEGIFDNRGAGFGSCTHVWNYEQVTPFLFGSLAKTMRDVEFGYGTDDKGLMSFRFYTPLEQAQKHALAATDGQMGALIKLYREWQHSGDANFLRKHWSAAKRALEFCWITGGWDANKDGVMEGAQHNTMDVEYFGPNPQMGFWYLAALRAMEKMADYLGEKTYASTCKKLYQNGARWMDEHLFNGRYYEQIIQPPMTAENIAEGLMLGRGAADLSSPDYQLGKGVLVDQLIGQVMAHSTDLGHLAEPQHLQQTNESIITYNQKSNLSKHTNFMRSFALGDESGLVMAAYPDERPALPFPYFTEVMTGFEYTAAVGMLYEKQEDLGLGVIQDVRDRYDGKKRNPFNEAEFGNHYARSMMAWGAVVAFTGFNYSAVTQSMNFNARNGTYFWSNGYAYGSITLKDKASKKEITLICKKGALKLKSFALDNFGSFQFKKTKAFPEGKPIVFSVAKNT